MYNSNGVIEAHCCAIHIALLSANAGSSNDKVCSDCEGLINQLYTNCIYVYTTVATYQMQVLCRYIYIYVCAWA